MKALEEDAEQKGAHDFGRDVLPGLLKTKRVRAYNFYDNKIPGVEDYEEEGYWRDVGTVKAYWEANMDLLGMFPRYDLSNREWPIRTEPSHGPPASLVNCHVDNAIIGEGTRIVDAHIQHSVIGRNVRIEPGAHITDSVIFDNTRIGAGAHLKRVIVDRHNKIPAGTELGDTKDAPRPAVHIAPSDPLVLAKPTAGSSSQGLPEF